MTMPRSLAPLLACVLFAAATLPAPEAQAQSLRPLVYLESDPDGARYVRVMERSYSAFTPTTIVQNLASHPRLNISSAIPVLVRNVTVRNAEYGVNITSPSLVSIDTFNFIDWNGGGGIYGAAIKVNRSVPAATYIQRVFADGREAPDSSYSNSNTDFISIERDSSPVFVRYATGRNFGDAGVDAKSNVALMNVTIDGAHRALRIWSGATLTIANAIINVPQGHEQVWMQHTTSALRYYNVLWCIGSANPSPSDPACTTSPTAIGVDNVTVSQARRQMTALSSNTLSDDSFFATKIDRVVLEYSPDNGSTWRVMATGGSTGRPPLGDLRYRVPFALNSGTYLFRAHFERNGARVGSTTTINEAGASV
jgi:hypothetical protein